MDRLVGPLDVLLALFGRQFRLPKQCQSELRGCNGELNANELIVLVDGIALQRAEAKRVERTGPIAAELTVLRQKINLLLQALAFNAEILQDGFVAVDTLQHHFEQRHMSVGANRLRVADERLSDSILITAVEVGSHGVEHGLDRGVIRCEAYEVSLVGKTHGCFVEHVERLVAGIDEQRMDIALDQHADGHDSANIEVSVGRHPVRNQHKTTLREVHQLLEVRRMKEEVVQVFRIDTGRSVHILIRLLQ